MKIILALMAVLVMVSGGVAMAADGAVEERVNHYEAQVIENAAQAIEVFTQKNARIAEILKAETLSGGDLEKIHEISYTLENAIDRLIADKAGALHTLEAIDEAVQAVHHASENHEEALVREWFVTLESSIAALDAPVAAEAPVKKDVYEIVIKDHIFTPDEIRIPAGEKVKLVIDNQDPTPEEFESDDFRREKIIAGNSKATIFVGPLKPGKYHFFGEFNLDTANGYLIAE